MNQEIDTLQRLIDIGRERDKMIAERLRNGGTFYDPILRRVIRSEDAPS